MLHLPQVFQPDPFAVIDSSIQPLTKHDPALVGLVDVLVAENGVATLGALYDSLRAAHDGFHLIRNQPRAGVLVRDYLDDEMNEIFAKIYYVGSRMKDVACPNKDGNVYCRVLTDCAREMGADEAEILAVHDAAIRRVEADAS